MFHARVCALLGLSVVSQIALAETRPASVGAASLLSDAVATKSGLSDMSRHPKVLRPVLSKLSALLQTDPTDDEAKSETAVDAFLTRMQDNPEQLAVLGLGLWSVFKNSRQALEKENYFEFFDAWKVTFWDIVESVVNPEWAKTDDGKESAEAIAAHQTWVDGIDELYELTVPQDGSAGAAAKAKEEGPRAWAPVATRFVGVVRDTLQAGKPPTTPPPKDGEESEIPLSETIVDVLTGMVDGWNAFQAEDKTGAFTSLYDAMTAGIWAAGVEKDSETGKFLLQIQVVVDGVTDTMDTMANPQEDAKICARETTTRTSVPVSVCYHGFTFNPETNFCEPTAENGADCVAHACEPNEACPSFCPSSKRYCCKKGDNTGACKGATFVDLLFTHGSPSDYYQCVSPVFSVVPSGTSSLLEADEKDLKHSLLKRAQTSVKNNQSVKRSLDESTSGKGDETVAVVQPFGSHRPVCDPNSEYNTVIDGDIYAGKCYTGCASGYSEVLVDDKPSDQCLQQCYETAKQKPHTLYSEQQYGITGFEYEVCATSPSASTNTGLMSATTDMTRVLIETMQKFQADGHLEIEETQKLVQAVSPWYVDYMRPYCDFTDEGKQRKPSVDA